MKKLTYFLILLSLSISPLFAQQAQDYKGHYINAKGDVYFQDEKVGLVTKQGIIQDAKGKKVAFLNSDGTLSDAQGKKLGKVAKNGEAYYNANGELIFTVKDRKGETCDILDAKGNKIGSVDDGLKGSACALHCLSNGLDVRTHQKPVAKKK
ncbi:hypothetical protein GO755_28125 [Spirosoma sp. HMF4905]|uniref:WG repeat-containing protein n=1 Tax=Spirosoma arboris TaxID=2682092 RepID=A0A7K1SK20_9BACT|nr:hypothetical protein [Spirosoma arboris]MVM33936.1 hypothetical protein [Spirosoma arboris]